MSYKKVLEKTECESVKTTIIRKRRLVCAGGIVRQHSGCLPNEAGDVQESIRWREPGTR